MEEVDPDLADYVATFVDPETGVHLKPSRGAINMACIKLKRFEERQRRRTEDIRSQIAAAHTIQVVRPATRRSERTENMHNTTGIVYAYATNRGECIPKDDLDGVWYWGVRVERAFVIKDT